MYGLLIPVNSSSIRAVGYSGGYLYVSFWTSDTIYTHPGVPYSLYIAFINAPSLGAFYNRHIRGNYK